MPIIPNTFSIGGKNGPADKICFPRDKQFTFQYRHDITELILIEVSFNWDDLEENGPHKELHY